ncbi:MAG: GNAT family N-acetyltransferase [Anaerolineae bacterium]|nr:GNAT family N-acetyltransferase [Anaerolineae bacterium]
MTTLAQTPTPLVESDYEYLSNLLRRSQRCHIHLDWRDIEQWFDSADLCCRATRQNGLVESFIGATIHTPASQPSERVAWLRFILPSSIIGRAAQIDTLWEVIRTELRTGQVRQIAALSFEPWTAALLEKWGFTETNAIITLRRKGGPLPPPISPPLTIREATTTNDLDQVAYIDEEAFSPLWQYSRATLGVAWRYAATCTLLEKDGQPVGYQLSTMYQSDGHLARLAVLPAEQGQGFGGMLVGAMLRIFKARGIDIITVNTQRDNVGSRKVYEKLGFESWGSDVPVWTLDL